MQVFHVNCGPMIFYRAHVCQDLSTYSRREAIGTFLLVFFKTGKTYEYYLYEMFYVFLEFSLTDSNIILFLILFSLLILFILPRFLVMKNKHLLFLDSKE